MSGYLFSEIAPKMQNFLATRVALKVTRTFNSVARGVIKIMIINYGRGSQSIAEVLSEIHDHP